jgi:hypothetical protein
MGSSHEYQNKQEDQKNGNKLEGYRPCIRNNIGNGVDGGAIRRRYEYYNTRA